MKRYIKLCQVIMMIAGLTGCFTVNVNFSGAKVHPDAKTFSVLELTNRAEIIE